jgi:hypothetical protein
MNLDETEIIKCCPPLLSVNPRSNKALAAGTRQGRGFLCFLLLLLLLLLCSPMKRTPLRANERVSFLPTIF